MKFQAVILSVLVIYLQQGEAIKCYQCTSLTNDKCADHVESLEATECTPDVFKQGTDLLKGAADSVNDALGKLGFNSDLKVPSADAAFTCIKTVRQDGDKKVVVRGCSVKGNDDFDFCSKTKNTQGALVTFCENCDGDKCNSAAGLTPVLLFTLLTSCMALFLTRQ